MIKTIDNLYPKDLMNAVYEVTKNIFMPSSCFYLSVKDFYNKNGYESLKIYLPDVFVNFIFKHLQTINTHFPFDLGIIDGFEIWVGISGNDSKSIGYLHKDNDEYLREQKGVLRTPVWGSILYLTPIEQLIYGGGTFFIKESFKQMQNFQHYNSDFLKENDNVVLIKSELGRFVQFDGDLSHAVEDFKIYDNNFPRVNILINAWGNRISSVPVGVSNFQTNLFDAK